jgi:hypothetical protein
MSNESQSSPKKYKLDPMSEEQEKIYHYIQEGHNVIVDACAGSGKSTTILSIAKNMPHSQFTLITYNSMLCEETRIKVKDLELENIHVYTFHALAVRYYDKKSFVDSVIRKIITNNVPMCGPPPKIHVLVIDESQDMTFLYFKLILKFCKDCNQNIQLLILGDYMQGLYEFKGADIRFLTCADKIWSTFCLLKSKTFHKCTLRTSYRITRQMANFVNDIMLGENRLLACKDGPKVVYLRRKLNVTQYYIAHVIEKLIINGANYDDILVLGASVKGERSHIRQMENYLVLRGIPCHVPTIETSDKIDEKVIKNKVVFATFHAVKGRQRKYVFVMGFDHTYFKYNARGLSPYICPNTLYVACTRATTQLVVIENEPIYGSNTQLKFLKLNHHQLKTQDYIDFQGIPAYRKPETEDEIDSKPCIHNITPTKLIQFISESVLEEINPILESIFLRISPDNLPNIGIPTIINTSNNLYEDVCDLNGITIPIVFFEKLQECTLQNSVPHIGMHCDKGGATLITLIDDDLSNLEEHEHEYLKKCRNELNHTCNTISEYLRLANLYVAVKEKLYFKYKQIPSDEYTWLSVDIMKECFKRMYETLGKECVPRMQNNKLIFPFKIEETIVSSVFTQCTKKINDYLSLFFPNDEFFFTARVDLITDDCVWEIKCVNTLSNDHFLQVVIYAWLWRLCVEDIENLENIREFKLFNIKTGEIYVLHATSEELNFIVIALLRDKFGNKETKVDNDFITECQQYMQQTI